MVDYGSSLRWSRELLASRGIADTDIRVSNILKHIELVGDILADMSNKERSAIRDLDGKLRDLVSLRDNAQALVEADPMILYKPAHNVAEEFHASPARIRYFYGGNRISKSQSGIADDYWLLTRQHPWRQVPTTGAVSVALVGVNYKQYKTNVFEKKAIIGEPDNPLSPIFPEGGKWLHHYDPRQAVVYIACVDCANKGKATSCNHAKATWQLFSDEGGFKSFQGAQYNQVHFDEQIKEEFFIEGKQRLKTVKGGSMIVTETPVYGQAWWTYKDLYLFGKKGKPENWIPELNIPIVSLHTIDQFAAGLVPHHEIRADMSTSTESHIRARIFGEHVAANENAVFDTKALDIIAQQVSPPKIRGELLFDREQEGESCDQILGNLRIEASLGIVPTSEGRLHIWEPPHIGAQYVIGADVSQGLANKKGDFSAAVVLRMIPSGATLAFKVVAVWHGYVDTFRYADELYKLGLYYNEPDLVIENNGPGMAVIQRLNEQLACPFLFLDNSTPLAIDGNLSSNFGITTTAKSKAMMISALQSTILGAVRGSPTIEIPSEALISELRIFSQEVTEAGHVLLKAAGSGKDDLVMATAIAVYSAKAHNLYDYARTGTVPETYELDAAEAAFWDDMHDELEGDA